MIQFKKILDKRNLLVLAVIVLVVFNFNGIQLLFAASPTVVTGAASSVTKTSASISGTISGNGGAEITDAGYEYGTTVAYGSTISASNSFVYNTRFGSTSASPGFFEGGLSGPRGVAIDSSGNIWVADLTNNRVQKFNSSHVFQFTFGRGVDTGATTYEICTSGCQPGTTGTGNGEFNAPAAIAFDSAGNLYVTEIGNQRVQKFDSSGGFIDEFGMAGTDAGQFQDPYGIAIDEDDNIYIADTNNFRVQKFNSAHVFQLMFGRGVDTGAASFEICTSGCQAGSQGTGNGEFKQPYGIDFDSSGDIWITEINGNRVQQFDSSINFLSTFGSDGVGVTNMSGPTGIYIDASDNIYIAEIGLSDRIHKYDPFGGNLGFFSSSFSFAANLAFDAQGNVYVSDVTDNSIKKFSLSIATTGLTGLTCGTTYHFRAYATNADGTSTGSDATFTTTACEVPVVATVAATNTGEEEVTLNGRYVSTPSGGGGLISRGFEYGLTTSYGSTLSETGNTFVATYYGNGFSSPTAVAVDSIGNIYVADTGNNLVQKLDSTGTWVSNLVPNGAAFSGPTSVYVDSDDNLYVADPGNNRVQKFNSSGTFQLEIGTGLFGSTFFSVAVASDGTIYVADPNNGGGARIARFDPSGAEIGDFAPFEFVTPRSIDFDSSDNVYIADVGDSYVKIYDSGGSYITAFNIYLSATTTLTVDSDGYIYIADTDYAQVFKYDTVGTLHYTFSGSPFGFNFLVGITEDLNGNIFVVDSSDNHVQKYSLNFSRDISLECDTEYHYRAFATNNEGTGYGADQTVTPTCDSEPPEEEEEEGDVGQSDGATSSGFQMPKINIKDDATQTSSRFVDLEVTAPFTISYFEVSNTPDFAIKDTRVREYTENILYWDICSGLQGCAPGPKKIYARFYDKYGSFKDEYTEINYDPGKECPYFRGYLRRGSNNDPEEVRKAQGFLNGEVGTSLAIDGIFGRRTEKAVREFQEKYPVQILNPWPNLDHSTGWWYITTSAYANVLVGC